MNARRVRLNPWLVTGIVFVGCLFGIFEFRHLSEPALTRVQVRFYCQQYLAERPELKAEEIQLLHNNMAIDYEISPDQLWVVYTGGPSHSLWVFDRKEKKSIALTRPYPNESDTIASWSADGKSVVFRRAHGIHSGMLYLINITEPWAELQLTDRVDLQDDWLAQILPNKSAVMFVRQNTVPDEAGYNSYDSFNLVDTDHTKVRQFLVGPGKRIQVKGFAISPNSRLSAVIVRSGIQYYRWQPDKKGAIAEGLLSDSELYVVDLRSGHVRLISHLLEGMDRLPKWTSDGRYIVYSEKNHGAFVIDPRGKYRASCS